MSRTVLSRRDLNRALLARQWLDRRRSASVVEAVEHLAGLQAQQAAPPFTGLWTRLEEFTHRDLLTPIHERDLVRATVMRATLHLLSSRDYLAFRTAFTPMLERRFRSALGKHAGAIPMDTVLAAARKSFARRPLTFQELRDRMKEAFPDLNERVIGYAARTHLDLVTVPATSPYAFQPNSPYTPAASWLGRKPVDRDEGDTLVLRYLAAFGPASPADFQAWSGMSATAARFARLRRQLAVYRDESGRELFDVPGSPLPGEDGPAPVRFLPEFDNVVLSHKDRSRIIDETWRARIVSKNLLVAATFLCDGFVAGSWTARSTKNTATLQLHPFAGLDSAHQRALSEEGERLLAFLFPECSRPEIVFA